VATATLEGGKQRTIFLSLSGGRRRLELDGQMSPAARSGDRRICLATRSVKTEAFDDRTGRLLWSRPGSGWGTTLALPTRTLMVLRPPPGHVAFDLATGLDAWERPSDGMSHLEAIEGRLFALGSGAGTVREIDPDTGADRATLDLPGKAESLGSTRTRLIVRQDRGVVLVRPKDRSVEWTWTSDERVSGAWGHHETLVVDVGESKKVVLDAATGRETGRLEIPRHRGASPSLGTPGLFFFRITDRKGGPGESWILNTSTGSLLRRGSDAVSYSGTTRGLVFLRRGTELSRLDADTGESRWTAALPGTPLAAKVLPDRAIFLFDGFATARDAATGRELWRTEPGAGASKATFGWFSP
jgi:outer membrane protein assembly factor BamB